MNELLLAITYKLARPYFAHDTDCWLFAQYYYIVEAKSETLLSLRDTIEHWRTTPYPVLFEEMRQ